MHPIELLFYKFLTYSPLIGALGVAFLILYFVCNKWKPSIRKFLLLVGWIGIGQGVLVVAFFALAGILGIGPVPS